MINKGINFVIGALVVILVATALLPTILTHVADLQTNTNLTGGTSVLVGLMPFLVVIAIFLIILGYALSKKHGA